jgi:hypothetical protein
MAGTPNFSKSAVLPRELLQAARQPGEGPKAERFASYDHRGRIRLESSRCRESRQAIPDEGKCRGQAGMSYLVRNSVQVLVNSRTSLPNI